MQNLKYSFLLSSLILASCAMNSNDEPFRYSESTIAALEQDLASEEITCQSVVTGYLDRIERLDKNGPVFNSIINVNSKALEQAAALDNATNKNKPLFCVPIVVKDNIDTVDMPTTIGVKSFSDNQPIKNARLVQNLIDNGAIILAKSNLDELAIAMLGLSSVHGQTKNVYIPTNGPGGSSGGTATAVSANLAMVGLGSDTGGSIRIPSALAGLVGIRPTQSLSDLRGVAPLSPTQDTVGPMCRKVEDCAKVLQFTEKNSSAARKKQIVNALNGKGLKGAKIAMVSAMFPPRTTENKVYWQVIDEALEAMQEAGAIVHDVVLPEQDKILNDFISLSRYEIKPSLNEYLQSWPSDKDAHIRDYDEMLAVPNGLAASTVPWVTLYGEKSDNRDSDPVYLENSQGRYEFVRKQVLSALGSHDALLYPTLTELNGPIGKNTEGRKNVSLSPFSGMPAISFPAGMTKDANPQPIAFELLGKDGSEPVLINLVAGFEKAHNARVEPKLAK